MCDGNLFLEWNSHKNNLSSNLTKLLRAQEFVDVTLVAEGHLIRCHRVVLSASSSFFDSVLQGTDANYPIIILPEDVKLWHLQGIVDYIYLGELTIDKTGFNEFINSARVLKIRGLCDIADNFIDVTEEYNPKKNEVEEDIEPNQHDTKNYTTIENPQQVVSTTTNDAPVSVNNRDQTIKEAGTRGLPPAYQERGPILNNIVGCMQPPALPEILISRDITRPVSQNGRFEYRMNKESQETSIDGNSSNFENRSHIKPPPPVSHTLTAKPPSMNENSANLPGYFENPTNNRNISDQSITPQAANMLKRVNNSPTPNEKRPRLSHPPQLNSDMPNDFHRFHLFSTVPPNMPLLKRNVPPNNLRGPASSIPPDSQQYQQFNMPGNYRPPPMHLSQPQPGLPGLVPPPNMNPHLLPHPSMYLHPNLRAFANNYLSTIQADLLVILQ